MISFAKSVALSGHQTQLYGSKPYSYHLDKVVALATDYLYLLKNDYDRETLISVCWLHDYLEDVDADRETFGLLFGSEIAEAVSLLTTKTDVPRHQRYTREFYNNLRANKIAVMAKVCDRIANVKEGRRKLYQKEHRLFCECLYREDLAPMFYNLGFWIDGVDNL